MDSSFRDWAGLPKHLLDLIVKKLGPLSDFVRYCAVCSQWRDAAFEIDVRREQYVNILKESRKKLPMLMITTEADNEEKRGLYSVFDGITFNIQLPLCYRNKFIGSSHGWLICMEKDFAITLVNPFTNSCISLPPFDDFEEVYKREWNEVKFEYYARKAILTADPLASPNDFAVLVIYGGLRQLTVYKSGDCYWDFIDMGLPGDTVLMDIISYKDCIYGLTNLSKLVEIDINDENHKTIVSGNRYDADSVYLVESQEGDILLVKRIWDPMAYVDYEVEDDDAILKTIEFKIFKLVHPVEEELGTWVQINNIGEQALFVGDNRSLSIPTPYFPKCKSNSIYYTDARHIKYPPYRCQGVDEDLGFYTLEDQCFHPLQDVFEFLKPSIWFVPNPE